MQSEDHIARRLDIAPASTISIKYVAPSGVKASQKAIAWSPLISSQIPKSFPNAAGENVPPALQASSRLRTSPITPCFCSL